jgi:hypothetical protein
MNRRRFHISVRNGSVLLIVMIIVVLMMVIGLGVTTLGWHGRLFAVRSSSRILARSAADSGLSQAVDEMNAKLKIKPWDDSTLPAAANVPVADVDADASFDYTVSEESNDVYYVEAVGHAVNSIHKIHSSLRLYSPFDYAMLTRGPIELKNTGKLDWINYQPDDWPARIGTLSIAQSAVLLMNGSNINGDVMVGVGGNPDEVITSKSGVVITGGTYPLTSEPPLPEVNVPEYDLNGNIVRQAPNMGSINSTRTISSTGKYSDISLKQGNIVTIDQPITLYITGSVTMNSNTRIIITASGLLTLYVTNDFDAGNSQGFNNLTQDARKLLLLCLPTCTYIKLKNSANFYGAIYAPYANITLDNGADVYGSIVGSTFILKNNGTFYYDANLRDRTVNDALVRFTTDRWSEN